MVTCPYLQDLLELQTRSQICPTVWLGARENNQKLHPMYIQCPYLISSSHNHFLWIQSLCPTTVVFCLHSCGWPTEISQFTCVQRHLGRRVNGALRGHRVLRKPPKVAENYCLKRPPCFGESKLHLFFCHIIFCAKTFPSSYLVKTLSLEVEILKKYWNLLHIRHLLPIHFDAKANRSSRHMLWTQLLNLASELEIYCN